MLVDYQARQSMKPADYARYLAARTKAIIASNAPKVGAIALAVACTVTHAEARTKKAPTFIPWTYHVKAQKAPKVFIFKTKPARKVHPIFATVPHTSRLVHCTKYVCLPADLFTRKPV